jgi:hypothetical protein
MIQRNGGGNKKNYASLKEKYAPTHCAPALAETALVRLTAATPLSTI